MKEPESRLLQSIRPCGAGLRVEFVRQGRRWRHTIFLVDGNHLLPILESVEGNDDQPFPPSPPWQQLVWEKRADDVQVALSLGMAGKNHWSVCAEAFSGTATVRLDVACRCQLGSGDQLGSAYLPLAPWHWSDGDVAENAVADGTAYLSAVVGNCRCCLVPQPVGGGRAAAISLLPGRLVIRPRVEDAARTQRWCYQVTASRTAESG